MSTVPYSIADSRKLRPDALAFCAEHPEACHGSEADPGKLARYQQECYSEARQRLLIILSSTASDEGRIDASVIPVGNTFFVTTTKKRHDMIKAQLSSLLTTPSTPRNGGGTDAQDDPTKH